MKKRTVLAIITLAVASLLLASSPVVAGEKTYFTGTWCRHSFDGLIVKLLPSGRLFTQGGDGDWWVNTDDPRVSGLMHSYNTVFNLSGDPDFLGDLKGTANVHFTLIPDGYPEGTTWEGVYSCQYAVLEGIRYHTLILNGHGTGEFAGKAIKIHEAHEIPFPAAMLCGVLDDWQFNGYIIE